MGKRKPPFNACVGSNVEDRTRGEIVPVQAAEGQAET